MSAVPIAGGPHKPMRISPLPVAVATALRVAAAQDPLSGSWEGYWTRAGDTMRVSMTVQRDTTTNRYSATFDSDRLRVSGIPFAGVQLNNCCDVTLTLRGDRTTSVFTGNLKGDSLTGTFQEGNSSGAFAYVRSRATAPVFDEREVTFSNGDVHLAGTLLLPTNGEHHAGVVFLHGSGAEGRWASRFLASLFARHGVAALIFDKRGVGQSSGDWRKAKVEDLVGDAAAAVAFLRHQPRVDSNRVGLHGHSQGGTIAPFVAARASGVAFVIGSAAAGTPTDSTERYSLLNTVYAAAATVADSADARTYVDEVVSVAYHHKPRAKLDVLATAYRDRRWFFPLPARDNSYWAFSADLSKYRPLDWWSKVTVPVLLLYGAADQRVPPTESAARIAAALLQAGNIDVTVRIFPSADHTFRLSPGPGGWPLTASDYLTVLHDWLSKR